MIAPIVVAYLDSTAAVSSYVATLDRAAEHLAPQVVYGNFEDGDWKRYGSEPAANRARDAAMRNPGETADGQIARVWRIGGATVVKIGPALRSSIPQSRAYYYTRSGRLIRATARDDRFTASGLTTTRVVTYADDGSLIEDTTTVSRTASRRVPHILPPPYDTIELENYPTVRALPFRI